MTPNRKSLESLLAACRIHLTSQQLDQLWHYHRLLREADSRLNLTRIRNFENMVLKHYVDSLLVLDHTTLPSPLIDMGSGPGLPGIPLKIARPQIAMILAEPRGARAEFLDHAVATLGLQNVEVYAGKVGPRFPRTARGVITRAVAEIPETLELVAPLIEPGGRMIFMKGPTCDDEINAAARAHSASFTLKRDISYDIPGTTHHRRLVIYQRTAQPAPTPAVENSDANPETRPPHSPPSRHDGPVREITSAANPTFKQLRELLHARGIRKENLALLAGTKVVPEALELVPDRLEAWVTDSGGTPPPRPSLLWLRVADPLFRELDSAGTHAPLLLVKVPELPAFDPDTPWPPGCTLFIPFQDPENVGAVIRSAAALNAARVVLLREAAHPFHPRSSRAAGTALFQIPLLRGPSIHDLDPARAPLHTLSTTGGDLPSHPFPPTFGLVPGLEGPGLPANLLTAPSRRIPIAPGVESLNAATATAIALYEFKSHSMKMSSHVNDATGEVG